jgi:hypothetical protein
LQVFPGFCREASVSEYQYVGFRAIDEPVNKKHLDFMERQSSHAKSTPWTFDVEYHVGDFRGNAREMLRRGYDVHLHYANFGIRTLMIRLPGGLPYAAAAKPYFVKKSLEVAQDKKDPGKKTPAERSSSNSVSSRISWRNFGASTVFWSACSRYELRS